MARLTEKEITEKLQEIEIPPFSIDFRPAELYLPFAKSESKYRPDLSVDLGWAGKTFRFVAEIKNVATPKLIDQAVSQLNAYLAAFENRESNRVYPLVVTPFLSEKQISEFESMLMNGIDLSGNMILNVPGELFVRKTGNPNRYPSSARIKNVYRGTSSIVARVILARPRYDSVNNVYDELVKRGGMTSLGTVSKVLKTLEEDFLIYRDSGVRLIDAPGLVRKLRESYCKPRITKRTIGKVAGVEEAVRKIIENCKSAKLLCAVDEPQKYAVLPTVGAPVRVYCESKKEALSGIEFDETDRFANIELIETSDSWVYFDRKWDRDSQVFYTSILQTYLELATGGKREQDAAEQLLEQILGQAVD